jgi:3-phosphoshikimate 1-carboxyvinyltransferase
MKVSVKKSFLSGEVRCPASKSYTHRAIAISSLSDGKSQLNNILIARDTIATLKCCMMLGAEVKIKIKSGMFSDYSDKLLDISQIDHIKDIVNNRPNSASYDDIFSLDIRGKEGSIGFNVPDDVLPADNSGTTIRLLTSMCSLVKEGYSILSGDRSLRKRPMKDLLNALSQLGVTCFSTNTNDFPPIVVKGGGIQGGLAQVSGKISSQFLSSLLLSGVFSKKGITLEILGNQVSKPYIDSTLYIMNRYGIKIRNEMSSNDYQGIRYTEMDANLGANNSNVTARYSIDKEMHYEPTDFVIPGDFSTAALLFSAAFLTESMIKVTHLDFKTPQGDMQIIDILNEMGGKIVLNEDRGTAKVDGSSKLNGGTFDLRKTPDLLPVVAVLSLKAKGITKITGISHARYKETDRVANIAKELTKFGAQVIERNDSIDIEPPKQIRNAQVQSYNDHRLFMAFAIAGLSTEHTQVDGADSVDVSYPKFVSDISKIGGRIQYID